MNNGTKIIFSKHWEFSQKISFDIFTIDSPDLFVLLQSYLFNKELTVIKIYSYVKTKEEKAKILSYSNVFNVKRMNFFFFSIWWENISDYDKRYVLEEKKRDENNEFGIIIVFSKPSFISYCEARNMDLEDAYLKIKPKYPWNHSIQTYLDSFK